MAARPTRAAQQGPGQGRDVGRRGRADPPLGGAAQSGGGECCSLLGVQGGGDEDDLDGAAVGGLSAHRGEQVAAVAARLDRWTAHAGNPVAVVDAVPGIAALVRAAPPDARARLVGLVADRLQLPADLVTATLLDAAAPS